MAIGRPIDLTPNVASKNISVIATAGQTEFTVSGGYRINQIAVFRNGVRLVDGRDFTARDGSLVVLLSASTASDVIEFQIFDSFNVSATIVSAASTQTIDGNLTVTGTANVLGGVNNAQVGIQSAGTVIGAATTLNFVGSGNTFAVNGNTIDVSISGSGGGGGGGIGTAIKYSDDTTVSPFSFIDKTQTVTEDLLLDTSNAGANDSYIVSVVPDIVVASGIAVTVGSGKTMIIDVLQIGDL